MKLDKIRFRVAGQADFYGNLMMSSVDGYELAPRMTPFFLFDDFLRQRTP
jgi:hypothetical protein